MLTCSLASSVPAPRILSTLLLLAASLNAQNEIWDSPSCTEDVVSVLRGSPAVMACNISNAFTDVSIRLIAGGQDRTIFKEMPPGLFSRGGWQLQIQGGQAQLVIQDAQDAHAGLYFWQLHGRQRENKNITLNVSHRAQ
uniref:Secreted and transmembrane protein 1 n=1 Tax=Nannospalax galili TaxID=1026970 RepID=A0A8C6Q7Y7_NANGA